jgi:hypothetical protein
MKKFIIHISKFVYTGKWGMGRGKFKNKRIELLSPDLMTAYNKSIELNPGFVVNMIWPE